MEIARSWSSWNGGAVAIMTSHVCRRGGVAISPSAGGGCWTLVRAGRELVGCGKCQGHAIGPSVQCNAASVVTGCQGRTGLGSAREEAMRLELLSRLQCGGNRNRVCQQGGVAISPSAGSRCWTLVRAGR